MAALHLGACRLDWNFRPGTAGPIAYSRDRAGSHWVMIRMEFRVFYLGFSKARLPYFQKDGGSTVGCRSLRFWGHRVFEDVDFSTQVHSRARWREMKISA